MAGTSPDKKLSPEEEEMLKSEGEGKKGEPAGEAPPEEEEDIGSLKTALKESRSKLKRYKEQVSGSQEEATKLKKRIEELESKIPKEEPGPGLSPQDKAYKSYITDTLGLYTKEDVDKILQEKIAPFQARTEAREKSRQRRVIDKFVGSHSDLSDENDPEGVRMKRVIDKLRRISPADPFDPNASLSEDLERAYNWAFEEETSQEALSKAKAEGRAEGHEAAETKVGEGASAPSTGPKKARTPAQEELLKEWGVDDESLEKAKKK